MSEGESARDYTLREAAERLGLSAPQVRRRVRDGRLPAVLVPCPRGREYRVSGSAVDELAAERDRRDASRETRRLGSRPELDTLASPETGRLVSDHRAALERACPKCGTPRVGAFRYCRSCGFDFDVLPAAPVAPVAPAAPPVQMTPQQQMAQGSIAVRDFNIVTRLAGIIGAVIGFVVLGYLAYNDIGGYAGWFGLAAFTVGLLVGAVLGQRIALVRMAPQ